MKKGKHYIKNNLTFGYYCDSTKKFVSLGKATMYPSFEKAFKVKEKELSEVHKNITDVVTMYS